VDPVNIPDSHGPEYYVQNLYIPFLETRGWWVERFIGNAFQSGIPDLYLFNEQWGERWVDIKIFDRYSFTPAQRDKWPKWEKVGIGIWILGAESREACTRKHMAEQHKLLFQPPNWRDFWKDSWDPVDIDRVIDEEFNGNSEMSEG
jgi:hypothetical protein